MSLFCLFIGFLLGGIGCRYLYIKHAISVTNAKDGRPLLDYVVFTPLIFGFATYFISLGFGTPVSGFLSGFIALVVTTFTLWLTWQIGARRRAAALQ